MTDGWHINAGILKPIPNTDGTITLTVESDLGKTTATKTRITMQADALDGLISDLRGIQGEIAIGEVLEHAQKLDPDLQAKMVRRMGFVAINHDRLHVDRLNRWIRDREQDTQEREIVTGNTLRAFADFLVIGDPDDLPRQSRRSAQTRVRRKPDFVETPDCRGIDYFMPKEGVDK